MKITNQDVITLFTILDSLANKEMPILLTYKVVNNLDKLLKAYQVYDKAKSKAKSDSDIQELLKIGIEIDLEKIDKQELIDAEIKLSPYQLVGLKEIING